MATTANSSGKAVNPRRIPRQQRSQITIDRIMDVAAEILEEQGFDKLNTNLICSRAGLSPPALYRYFPNKYAVLKALGERLMRAQNDALYATLDDIGARPTATQIALQLRKQYDVTIAQKGGPWVMRALNATPQLTDVSQASHQEMVARLVAVQLQNNPKADQKIIKRRSRIIVETGYAALEMLFDNPHMDVDASLADVGLMLSALLDGAH